MRKPITSRRFLSFFKLILTFLFFSSQNNYKIKTLIIFFKFLYLTNFKSKTAHIKKMNKNVRKLEERIQEKKSKTKGGQ